MNLDDLVSDLLQRDLAIVKHYGDRCRAHRFADRIPVDRRELGSGRARAVSRIGAIVGQGVLGGRACKQGRSDDPGAS